jgi:formylmethanofuran dehydrogenase subunit E
MRMGRYALGKLKANPHFGIEAHVWCPAATPVSCLLDGIQYATGCTLGKQNIHHHISNRVRAIFTNRDTGQSLALRLRSAAMERAVAEMHAKNDEAGAALIQDMTDEELLEEIPAQ